MSSTVPLTVLPITAPAIVHDPKTHELSIQDLPVPSLRLDDDPTGQHLVHVRAVGITKTELDWPQRPTRGLLIPGFDMSGIVIRAPRGSSTPIETEVYARLGCAPWYDQGAARPYTIAEACEMARKPRNITFEEAATVPISALTAWQAIFVHAGFAPPLLNTPETGKTFPEGKRVLINGASGGVGIFAVQLARLASMYVVATCGTANVDFIHELGADEVLDYQNGDLEDLALWFLECPEQRAFDLVLDMAGGSALKKAWITAKEGGILISVAQHPEQVRPTGFTSRRVKSLYFVVEPDRSQLERVTALIETGALKVFSHNIWEMEDYEEAFQQATEGRGRGKVVLRISATDKERGRPVQE